MKNHNTYDDTNTVKKMSLKRQADGSTSLITLPTVPTNAQSQASLATVKTRSMTTLKHDKSRFGLN